MNKLSMFLSETYGAHLSLNLTKSAVYNEDMDCLEYVSIDDVTVSDRVDGFLTVMWNYEQKDIVGFRLKGFRCIFNGIIKPLTLLKEEDFNPLVEALEKIFTQVGTELFSGQNVSDSRTEAYKATINLVNAEKVTLPSDFEQAA